MKRIAVSLIPLVLFVYWLLPIWNSHDAVRRINGASLVNPRSPIDSLKMNGLSQLNCNWVAVIPFAFSKGNDPMVYFNTPNQWWGERVDGSSRLIDLAHECGLEVMLKPQVWSRGFWIGDFTLGDEESWLLWEMQYREYILTYARLAEEKKVGIFCLGTELKRTVAQRPLFWDQLIDEVKAIYSGKVTYAANWDNYQNIPFWGKLDYIGVDAYFPITSTKEPTLRDIEEGWVPIRQQLLDYSNQMDRSILLTEYGYQSVHGAVGNHWEVDHSKDGANARLQADAYEVLYSTLWQEPWIAGGFFWKWHFRDNAGGLTNTRFTPQGKPAEKVIEQWYAKNQ